MMIIHNLYINPLTSSSKSIKFVARHCSVKLMPTFFYKFDPIYKYVAACIIAYLGEVMCTTRRFPSSLIITILFSQILLCLFCFSAQQLLWQPSLSSSSTRIIYNVANCHTRMLKVYNYISCTAT